MRVSWPSHEGRIHLLPLQSESVLVTSDMSRMRIDAHSEHTFGAELSPPVPAAELGRCELGTSETEGE